MKRKALFITFEGTEGSGKSTHSRLLCQHLRKRGYKVLHTVEPGGTALGTQIRKLLLNASYTISPRAEALLYMASRAHLVAEVILPALRSGNVVVCDRWVDATVAYQGYGLGVDLRWIYQVAREATQGLEPDLTFFLDVDVETGLRRVARRGKPDRIERRKLSFHRKVRKGYWNLSRQLSRFRRVPVAGVDETQSRIQRVVEDVL